MSNDDEYRRQAAAAEKQARLAKFDSDRESWLRIAQGWLSLLSMRPQSEDEAFSAQSKSRRHRARRFRILELRPPPVGGLFHFGAP
jgi:hypothetical protein